MSDADVDQAVLTVANTRVTDNLTPRGASVRPIPRAQLSSGVPTARRRRTHIVPDESLVTQEAVWTDLASAVAPSDTEGRVGLAALDAVDWSFSESTNRSLTHGMHPWPAKFIPDIPATAIRYLSAPDDIVLDPFCGCGTTALESLAAGRGFVAADLNPLAVRITEGKCEVPTAQERRAILEWSQELRTQEPSSLLLDRAPAIPNLAYWFDEPVVAQLSYLLAKIRRLRTATAFLETVFSSIVVGVSRQESETRYRRVDRDISAGDVLERFRRKLMIALGMASTLDSHPLNTRQYLVSDARTLADRVEPGVAGLAVFSPPYPNAFDYHLYHRFRMFWLGFDPRIVKHNEIGAHLRYQPDHFEWLEDMTASFRAIAHAVRKGGFIVCVVGDGLIRGRTIPSGDLLWDRAGPEAGLRPRWRQRRHIRDSRKTFNLSDSRLKDEQVLVFQR